MSGESLFVDTLEEGVQLWVDAGCLRFRAPKGGFHSALRDRLRRYRGDLLSRLEPGVRYAPLSFAQQRLWFLDRLSPGRAAYHLPSGFRLTGDLCPAALTAAIEALVERHDSLRTTFPSWQGRPYQRIPDRGAPKLARLDLSGLPPDERRVEVSRRVRQEARRPFDLARGPLLRTLLARLGPEEHLLLMTVHHIVSDGWSQANLFRELGTLYGTCLRGEPCSLEPLSVRYSDHAAWQRQNLSTEVLDNELEYWSRQLAGSPDLELPRDRKRQPSQSNSGASLDFVLPGELAAGLERFSREHGATLFMTLLAAFQVLLQRHSGQHDFVVGSPVANRGRAEVESLIGFFANTLPLRSDLAGDPSFAELVERVRRRVLAAHTHQDLPFEKLVEELQPRRLAAKHPLFQVSFAFQNAPAARLTLPGLLVHELPHPEMPTHFDLELYCHETNGVIGCTFLFDEGLFDVTRVSRLADQYERLLRAAVDGPRLPLSGLAVVGRPERHQVLVEWNDGASDAAGSHALHRLFERRAASTPDAIAVMARGAELSYGELNRHANRLARYLRDLGVEAEHRVALFLERSPEFLIAMLAVLKAGGAYAPLQLDDPRTRLERALEVAWADQPEPRLLLTTSSLRRRLPPHCGQLLDLERVEPCLELRSDDNLDGDVDRRSLAYVLFTSGSTGHPKGVAMPHGPLLDLLAWHRRIADSDSGERTLQFCGLNYDVSFQEIFTTWDAGGSLVLVDEATRRDPEKLLEVLDESGAARLFLPYVALRQLAEVADRRRQLDLRLRRVVTGGEPLVVTPAIARFFARLGPGAILENHYGPTEVHIVLTFALAGVSSAWPPLPAIGRSVDGSRAYVLDRNLDPVPLGASGELFIGGGRQGRGYLAQPAGTAAVFLPDPFLEEPGARMYRTGDRARHLADGRIEFLGRVDHQVKVRGFRVEPSEIECALSGHPDVRAAVVTAPPAADGRPELVGYVVSRSADLEAAALVAFLRRRLPDYLIPRRFVSLDRLPRTPSGKLDRRRLPPPESRRSDRHLQEVGQTAVEAVVAEVLGELLDLEHVGPSDDFFDLGGHSLLAIQLLDTLERRIGVRLPVATLFSGPTVVEMAAAINRNRPAVDADRVVRLQPLGSEAPLFCIHPVGGNVLCYLDLARRMGTDRPVFGLQPTSGSLPADLRELAASHVRALLRACADGPFHLGGWSLGGLVGFEMAHQLRDAGHEVASVSLLDVVPPDDYRAGTESIRRRSLRALAEQLGSNGDRPPLPELEALVDGAAHEGSIVGLDADMVRRLYGTIETLLEGAAGYRPRPYPGRVGLFVAADRPDPERLEQAWRNLAEAVDLLVVPGDHFTMIGMPQVSALAGAVAGYLKGDRR